MNKQEMFDKVWDWFVTNKNAPSISLTKAIETCMYRGPNGTKCAFGVLIPDDVANSEFVEEFNSYSSEFVIERNETLKIMFSGEERFICTLQDAHDVAAQRSIDTSDGINRTINLEVFTKRITHRLTEIAESFKLQIPLAVKPYETI
jgi:hypothetical protein